MLKRFALILLAIILLAAPGVASITMNLTSKTGGSPVVDFGSMNGGEWKELYTGITGDPCNVLSVVSDTNVQWNVQISYSQPLTHSTLSSVTIPDDKFLWLSTYAGHWDSGSSSQWNLTGGLSYPPSGGYNRFYSTGTTVYTSGLVPGNIDNKNDTEGTQIEFKFGLAMPADQTAGSYTSTIVYTVTQ